MTLLPYTTLLRTKEEEKKKKKEEKKKEEEEEKKKKKKGVYEKQDTTGDFFIIKPTKCTIFTNLFCHGTLHVLDSSSLHHQEFIHCTLINGICHTGS
jgi:hypothetical protein